MEFLRYQSMVPNRRGHFPGLFALVNGLRGDGRLSSEEAAFVARTNRELDALYIDPSTVDPAVYGENPMARAWFRTTASAVLPLCQKYMDILDRHRIPWCELRTSSPGRILYEDDVQVVALPWSFPEDWPFDPK